MKIFDSHFHIINKKYPIVENQGYLPEEFRVEDYIRMVENSGLEICGGAVVSGSYHAFDQTYFAEAIEKLQEHFNTPFVGVTQLPLDTPNEELHRLNKIGIRAVRFNLFRGFSADYRDLIDFSHRIYNEVNWKTEFYLDASQLSEELFDTILKLPKTSIDHLGLSYASLDNLKKFLSKGIPVRVSGFGRIDYSETQLKETIKELHGVNPNGLIFATDIPSTRARRPFCVNDISLIKEVLGDQESEKVLFENGKNWYLG